MAFFKNKKVGILCLFVCSSTALAGAKVYQIKDISDNIYAEIRMSDIPVITVYDKKTETKLISQETIKKTINQDDNQVNKVLIPLAYKEQSTLVYQDINADGRPDILIRDSYKNSCKQGSYKVYLRERAQIKYSEKYSQLSREVCGFLKITH